MTVSDNTRAADWPIIGGGTERICRQNPDDPRECIKLSPAGKDKQTKREWAFFEKLIERGVPFTHIPAYHGRHSEPGYIGIRQEVVREILSSGEPGPYSPMLYHFIEHYKNDPKRMEELYNAMRALRTYLIEHTVIASDMDDMNILVRGTPDGIRLYVIDGFGSPELVPFADYITPLGKRKIARQWSRLIERTKKKIPDFYVPEDLR